jgi:hypothetical protein
VLAKAAFGSSAAIRAQGLICSSGSSACLLSGSGAAGNKRSSSSEGGVLRFFHYVRYDKFRNERTNFCRRFTGGFARKACSQGRTMQKP